MRTLEVLAREALDPDLSPALWRAARARTAAGLVLYGCRFAGAVLSLGRFHLAPAGDATGRVRLHRRRGGGRVLPLGPELAVLSLVLPHRSALVSDEPHALRPEQALNRAVRGLLAGLRALGVDAYYPGRDLLTHRGRMLGAVSLDVDAAGIATIEMVLALSEGAWAPIAERVAAVDPAGILTARLPSPDEVTYLAAAGGRAPALDEILHVVASAYAAELGCTPIAGEALDFSSDDAGAEAAAWIASRRLRPGLDRHALEWTQLGVLEVHAAVEGGRLGDVLLAGDFIADVPSVERLEQGLRGCPLERAALMEVVERVYADPACFLLGIWPRAILADTILRAAGQGG